MNDKKQKLDNISNDLSKCSGNGASAIVNKNGIVVSSCTNCGGDAETFGVISAIMFGAADIASNESGIGTAHRVIVHSKHNTLITENTSSQMLLSVLTENKRSLDSAHRKILKNIEHVRSVLENITLK